MMYRPKSSFFSKPNAETSSLFCQTIYSRIFVSLVYGILFLILDLFIWFAILRSEFDGSMEAFEWYVLYPLMFHLAVFLLSVLHYALHLKLSKSGRGECFALRMSFYMLSAVLFLSRCYFYKVIPISRMMIVVPILLVGFMDGMKWIIGQLSVTFVIYMCFFSLLRFDSFNNIKLPSSVDAVEGLVSFLIIGLTVGNFIRLKSELISQTMEARSSERAQQAFLANMSHEIRTPINAILGMNEMILRENRDSTVEQFSVNVRTAGQTLLATVNDILDISKIQAGQMEIVESEYGIASIIIDCYNLIYLRALDKDIEVSVKANADMPANFYGDAVRIRQVVTNLMTNAVKYTDDGYITLTVNYEPIDEKRALVSFAVKDTGIGISKENKEKLFKSFQRVDLEHNRNIEGTGLGLALTKSFVDMMDGGIMVDSELGKGSTFTVTIPQGIVDGEKLGDINERLTSEKKAVYRYQEKFRAPKARILVLDDMKVNLDLIKWLLKRTEIQVTTAINGSEALAKIKRVHFDAIFVDYLMPEMNGDEVLKRIKEGNHNNIKTPVIVLTADALSGSREKYLELGFDDYLTKPIASEQLEEALIKYLPPAYVELQDASKPEEKRDEAAQTLEDRLSFLDVKKGLRYSGDDETIYKSVIVQFRDDDKTDAIEEAYENRYWKDYRLLLHSLKSTAMYIGAIAMSEEAKHLEIAASSGSEKYIIENHAIAMKHYRELLERLEAIDLEE